MSTLQREAPPRTPLRYDELYCELHAAFPALFDCAAPVPLAIGIAPPPTVPLTRWHRFVRVWVGKRRYLQALARGGSRFNLDGTVAGEVSEAHQAYASRRLECWK
jgi:sRNA-binding protein